MRYSLKFTTLQCRQLLRHPVGSDNAHPPLTRPLSSAKPSSCQSSSRKRPSGKRTCPAAEDMISRTRSGRSSPEARARRVTSPYVTHLPTSDAQNEEDDAMLTMYHPAGLPPAAPEQPPAHEDAHIRQSCRATGSACVVDRARQKQAWLLYQLAGAEDGRLRRFHQRALGPCPHQHLAETVCWQDQLEGEDLADPSQQSSRKESPVPVRMMGSVDVAGCADEVCYHRFLRSKTQST